MWLIRHLSLAIQWRYAVAVITILTLFVGLATAQPSDAELRLVEGYNQFAFDLYHELVKDAPPDQNIVFSPFSVAVALSMVEASGVPQISAEIRRLLHLPDDSAFVRATLPPLLEWVRACGDTMASGAMLAVSNALFVEEDCIISPEFNEWWEYRCHGTSEHLDFLNRDRAAQVLNRWLSSQTHGRLDRMFDSGSIGPDNAPWLLMSSLWFQGAWLRPFKPERTRQQPFRTARGDTVQVMMMMNALRTEQVLESDSLQFLILPYDEPTFSLEIMLPRPDRKLTSIEAGMTGASWARWSDDAKANESWTSLAVPRSKSTYHQDIGPALGDLGLSSVPTFCLTRPGDRPSASIRPWFVKHVAEVELNEWGTTASAGTSIGQAVLGGIEPVRFEANRPFVMAIVDNSRGAILTLCRFVNPN